MANNDKVLARIEQPALDVIIARHKLYRASRPGGQRAILTKQDLSGLVFSGCDLSHADFTGSILQEANLEFSTMDSAVFFGCDLRKANFRNANLQRADLRGAVLRGAIMANADLTGADLREGSFAVFDPSEGLNFYADKPAWAEGVGGVDLRGANMESVRLSGAVAVNSNFEDANLANARAMRANLRGANMAGANLSGADFSQCELRDVNLRGANLVGARIDFSSMINVDTTGALTDKPVGRSVDQLPLPLKELVALHARWLASKGAEGRRLDVGGCDMRLAPSFGNANLTMMLADRSVWYAHDLAHVNMQAGHFAYGDLRSCNFDAADLRGSSFFRANLTGARLRRARFEPLELSAKRLMKSNFRGANLRYADFTEANLREADFTGADLSFADFTGADMKGAKFHDAILEGTKIDFSQTVIIEKSNERPK